MKPKKYYSYSRLNLYHSDPAQYYIQYVLGHKPSPTVKMEFGSIGHEALAKPKYNWRSVLRKKKFLAHDEMVMERALKEHPVCEKREIEFTVKFEDVLLYGFIDGMNPGMIRDTKFSAPGAWNRRKVDDDMQLGFYWLAATLMGHDIKCAWLDHVNNKTGEVKSYVTRRSAQDLEGVKNWIRYAVEGIKKGVFN